MYIVLVSLATYKEWITSRKVGVANSQKFFFHVDTDKSVETGRQLALLPNAYKLKKARAVLSEVLIARKLTQKGKQETVLSRVGYCYSIRHRNTTTIAPEDVSH
jgi:hypothetical protein